MNRTTDRLPPGDARTTADHIKEIQRHVKRVLFEIATDHPEDDKLPITHRRIIQAHAEQMFTSNEWVANVVSKIALDVVERIDMRLPTPREYTVTELIKGVCSTCGTIDLNPEDGKLCPACQQDDSGPALRGLPFVLDELGVDG